MAVETYMLEAKYKQEPPWKRIYEGSFKKCIDCGEALSEKGYAVRITKIEECSENGKESK